MESLAYLGSGGLCIAAIACLSNQQTARLGALAAAEAEWEPAHRYVCMLSRGQPVSLGLHGVACRAQLLPGSSLLPTICLPAPLYR